MPMTNGLPPHLKPLIAVCLACRLSSLDIALRYGRLLQQRRLLLEKRVFETPARCKMSDLDLSRST